MNRFDSIFFQKYVQEGDRLIRVCHRHVVEIIDDMLLTLFFWVGLPAFFYMNGSFGLNTIPFVYFEGYIACVYLFLLYRIFNWYNDVWLVTSGGVVDVTWNIYTGNLIYINYHSIHGVSIRTNSFIDSMLWRGDLVLQLEDEEDEFMLVGAENPWEVAEIIQAEVEESRSQHQHDEESQEEDDRQPFEVLLATLTDMVKEHIERKGIPGKEEVDPETEEQIRKVLRRSGTIDLTRD